jgi:hypothetical protein
MTMRLLIGFALSLVLVPALLAKPCVQVGTERRSGTPLRSWTARGQTLSVCGYGADPKKVSDTRWHASEFFVAIANKQDSEVLFDCPADTECEYSVENDTFAITYLTVAGDNWSPTPLVRHSVVIGKPKPWKVRSLFVLVGQPFVDTTFRAWMREFEDPATSFDRREVLIYRMRDSAVNRPSRGLPYLRDLKRSQWADGDLGEQLASVIEEVTLADQLQRETRARRK